MVSTRNSVRHRVLRKIKPPPPPESYLPPLEPGQMQLYSYFTPGVSTGQYDIIAEQTIVTSDGHQCKTIEAPDQSFYVDAPKFSIDPAMIHSTFPHQGVAAQANILPHIVLNDPHLPWQTKIGNTSQKDTLRIPWLAVIAFEQSELKLQPNDPLFPTSLRGHTTPPQSFTGASRLTIGQLTGSGLQCALPAPYNDLLEDSTLPSKSIDVIFPKMDLFLALFTNGTHQINLDRYKYLAHTRQVNTTHMTDSGVLDEGQFSIVFSHRTGPPFEKGAAPHPKRCVAHLISLDWVHRIPQSALKTNKRAALISLFSWTYDCIPDAVDFEGIMKAVGQNSGVYRSPDEMQTKISNNSRIKSRLEDGYTLLRYRVQTGEEFVALMRGPLTPCADPDTAWMDVHSNTGEDLQIIDTELGIIDISYCAAWQLGKSLAIANQAFCAALLRIRADVYDTSNKKAKEDALSQNIKAITSERVMDSLPQHFVDMKQLSKKEPDQRRWDRPSLTRSSYQHLAKKDTASVDKHLRSRVEHHALATDGTHHTELKDPMSTDWDLVLNWILDKLYLEKIPPWYLIPDPTWLPAESIRFFHVDRKWLSALIDGALSVANHLDAQDKVRQAIKDQLLKYLHEDIHPDLKHPPQIPSYGFYLRSVIVDALPDMVVRAHWPGQKDSEAEILRQENVRKDIMFCLLDRTPENLMFSQPPHQQCFIFGRDSTFTTESFKLELRKVYSVPTNKHMDELPKELSFSKGPDGRCEIYDWKARTILVDKFVGIISSALSDAHKDDSDIYNGEVNASLVGIELNDPIYRLTFAPPQPTNTTTPTPEKNYARPFKGVPRSPNLPSGRPRKSESQPPALATPREDTSTKPPGEKPSAPSSQLSVEPILSKIDSDDMEKCSSRFSPICFPTGSPSTAKNDEPKYLTPGSNVIVKLARNQSDPSSTDYIHFFEIRIPLGTSAECLFTKPLEMEAVQMLNTMRFTTSFGVYEKEIIIHLKPKAASERSPLLYNPDMSFMIKRAEINAEATDSTISIVEWYTSEGGNAKLAFNKIEHIKVKR